MTAAGRPALRKQLVGMGAASCVVVLFASFVLVSKYGMRTALEPWDLAALRFTVAGVAMLPVALKHGLMGLGLRRSMLLAASGGLGFALCAYWGFTLAPAHHGSALIHGTLPLTTALVSCTLQCAWPTRRQAISLLAVTAGAVAIIGTSLIAPDRASVSGDLFLLGASLCWSCFGVLSNRWRLPPFGTAALVAVASAAMYLPIYFAAGLGHLHEAALQDVVQQAVFQGLAIGVGSILAYSTAVACIGASATALAAAAVPILTAAGATIFLDEHLEATEIGGLALATLGIILGTLGIKARRRVASNKPGKSFSTILITKKFSPGRRSDR
jgi:drug/metabolite transporter (DMT)-like permease